MPRKVIVPALILTVILAIITFTSCVRNDAPSEENLQEIEQTIRNSPAVAMGFVPNNYVEPIPYEVSSFSIIEQTIDAEESAGELKCFVTIENINFKSEAYFLVDIMKQDADWIMKSGGITLIEEKTVPLKGVDFNYSGDEVTESGFDAEELRSNATYQVALETWLASFNGTATESFSFLEGQGWVLEESNSDVYSEYHIVGLELTKSRDSYFSARPNGKRYSHDPYDFDSTPTMTILELVPTDANGMEGTAKVQFTWYGESQTIHNNSGVSRIVTEDMIERTPLTESVIYEGEFKFVLPTKTDRSGIIGTLTITDPLFSSMSEYDQQYSEMPESFSGSFLVAPNKINLEYLEDKSTGARDAVDFIKA